MIMRSFSLFCLLLLTACSPIKYSAKEAIPIPSYTPPDKPVRVAVVLGGGGSRCLAHVGVLEELEKANIPIDLIVGCSGGAIVGSLYADCPNARVIKKHLYSLKKHDVLDYHVFNGRFGFVHGVSLHHFLCHTLHAHTFEELHIPFISVATDLFTGELVRFGAGPIIPTVQASSAIPGVFRPIRVYGRYLVDGGVVDPVPVETAYEYGADIIIAVDVSENLSDESPSHLFGISTRCLHICYLKLSEYSTQHADVIIKPQFSKLGFFNDSHNQEIYQAGKRAARQAIPLIQELLDEKQ